MKEEQIFWFSLAHPNEEVGTWINGPHCPLVGVNLSWAKNPSEKRFRGISHHRAGANVGRGGEEE